MPGAIAPAMFWSTPDGTHVGGLWLDDPDALETAEALRALDCFPLGVAYGLISEAGTVVSLIAVFSEFHGFEEVERIFLDMGEELRQEARERGEDVRHVIVGTDDAPGPE